MATNSSRALFAVQAIVPQTAEVIASINEAIELLNKQADHHFSAYQMLSETKASLQRRRAALEGESIPT